MPLWRRGILRNPPECSLQQAAVRAEEIRLRLRELHVERANEIHGMVTVSIGVAGFQETTDNWNLLLKFADDALYKAKRAGRDRVIVARSTDAVVQFEPTTQTVIRRSRDNYGSIFHRNLRLSRFLTSRALVGVYAVL